MTLTTFLLQALASLLAIITFLIVLNVQRSMLIPGGVLGMSIWLLYLILKEPTNVILATFIAAVIGSCISQIMSILYKTPAVVFALAILAPLVPGPCYLYRNGKWDSCTEVVSLSQKESS